MSASTAPDDCWTVKGRLQCPYRRLVFAGTPETFHAVSAGLDAALRDGFAGTDHYTFCMTEIFVNRASGKVASQKPDCFAGNLAVMERIVDLIAAEQPKALICVTVSPVPLQRTFSGQDIVVANTMSKSTLRAALGQLAGTRPNVRYFPSCEMVISASAEAWEADGRHVRRALVETIKAGFVAANFVAKDQ